MLNDYLVPYDGTFSVSRAPTSPVQFQEAGTTSSKKPVKKKLAKLNKKLYDLQRLLYAHNQYAVLLIFQAMDAAGKDSTIRTVMRGVNPAGCQVFSFKQPSSEELEHDFLWRSARCLPERGRIGIFNRSYYEEVLVVKVHPEYLDQQRLPGRVDPERIWPERYESIREHERHLARNGTVIIKFWLNVSLQEQKKRFLARLDNPEKNWKFSAGDVTERQHWNHYMQAYESALNQTSRDYAPWYAIPADNKPVMRLRVAEIIVNTLSSLNLHYPKVADSDKAGLEEMKILLEKE